MILVVRVADALCLAEGMVSTQRMLCFGSSNGSSGAYAQIGRAQTLSGQQGGAHVPRHSSVSLKAWHHLGIHAPSASLFETLRASFHCGANPCQQWGPLIAAKPLECGASWIFRGCCYVSVLRHAWYEAIQPIPVSLDHLVETEIATHGYPPQTGNPRPGKVKSDIIGNSVIAGVIPPKGDYAPHAYFSHWRLRVGNFSFCWKLILCKGAAEMLEGDMLERADA